MRKGHKNFVDFVNKTLLEMEKNGEAKKIFDKWFGPSSPAPMARTFRIIADK
jgi:polar amino acid transport system substrate-binding protein